MLIKLMEMLDVQATVALCIPLSKFNTVDSVSVFPSLPCGPATMMHVKFLGSKSTNVLAEASTCSLILSIPIVHE